MTRSSPIVMLAGVLVLLGRPLPTSDAADRPNIVFILADDLGHGDIGCHGCPDVKTPTIDGLAREGARFTRYYSNGPECTPTRTALMTGRYPQRVGGLECAIGVGNVGRYDDAIRLANAHDLGLPADHSVLPAALRDAGYATACVGKWHLGYEPKFNPLRLGFDRFFGVLGGNADYFTHEEEAGLPVLYEGERRVKRDGYLTHLLTDEAIRFVGERRTKPFFLYLAYTTPHSPYQGPKDATGKRVDAKDWGRGTRAKYVEMIEDMDTQIARLLKALKEVRADGNTVVIFASDNGGTKLGRNAPFAGHKGGLFEGGIRVPLVVRWPGTIKAGTEPSQVGMTVDLTVSLLRIAGAKPPRRALDGIDLLRHVEEGKADQSRTLYWRAHRGQETWRAVRDKESKYIRHTAGEKQEEWLFDLSRDPGEKESLLEHRPEDVKRLKGLLARWETEVRPTR
jgi:N-acetylgalactosamine-6-sulfatase